MLVHLAALPILDSLPPSQPQSLASVRPVSVTLVPRQPTAPRNHKRSIKKVPVKKQESPELIPEGQIVNLPNTPSASAPEDARFLAKTNSRTERETKSRHRRTDYKNAGNELTQTQRRDKENETPRKTESPVEIRPAGEEPDKITPESLQQGRLEIPRLMRRSELRLKLDPLGGSMMNQQSQNEVLGNGSALRLSLGTGILGGDGQDPKNKNGENRGPPVLMPNLGVLARLNAAPASDRLPDVEEGEGTFLNARRFKYASFFNRVHRGVSNSWRPMHEYRRRDPRGQVYGRATRVTVLSVTLNANGDLRELGVAQSSGLDFLDLEAIAAFKRAEPFPNPPAGLLENETIQFNFGFSLVLSPRGPFRSRY